MIFPDEIRPTKDIDHGGRKRLQAIVKAKQKNGTIEAPEPDDEPAPATDLMEALRKTMADLG